MSKPSEWIDHLGAEHSPQDKRAWVAVGNQAGDVKGRNGWADLLFSAISGYFP